MKNKKAILALAASLLLCSCGGQSTSNSSVESSTASIASSEATILKYTVTLTAGEHYTIAPVEGSGTSIEVEAGASFKFKVEAEAHYSIVSVMAGEAELVSSTGVYMIPHVEKNTVVTVEVKKEVVTVTLPSGTGYKAEPLSGYDPNDIVKGGEFKFTVVADAHYSISKVSIGEQTILPDESGVYTISNIEESLTVNVVVEEERHSLTLTAGELYSIQVITEGVDLTSVPYSVSVVLKIDAVGGHRVTTVKLNGVQLEGNGDLYTVTHLEEDGVITVEVEAETYTVTLTQGDNYTIAACEGYDPTSVSYGSSFEFTVVASEHHHIVSVKANDDVLTEADGKYRVSDISKNIVITVEAVEDTYAITMPSARSYDIEVLSSGVDLAQVKYSEEVRFKVTPKSHCNILSVKANGVALEAVEDVYTIKNQVADVEITVEANVDSYAITFPISEHYTVSAVEGYDPAKVEYGDSFSFTVTPAESYRIVSVSVDGEVLTAVDGVYTIAEVTSNKTISVEEEFVHVHSYDSYGECTVCGKTNLIAFAADTSKWSEVTSTDIVLPSQFEKLHKYDVGSGHYMNGVSIFKNANLSEYESISFYLSNTGVDNSGNNQHFFINDADVNTSGVTRTSGFSMGVSGTVTATQVSDGTWELTTDATDVYGRKGFFSTADWQPHDVTLTFENVTTLDQLIKFSSWNQTVYMSDINVVRKTSTNLGFDVADTSKASTESPEGITTPFSFGTMHKYDLGSGHYFPGNDIFNDVDITAYSHFKTFISNNGTDASNNKQNLFIADESIESSPKNTGILSGQTVAVYGQRNASGEWELTCDQVDQYNRKGFMTTTTWAPSETPVNVGNVNTLNDLFTFSSWSYSFYMSDIIVY